MPDNITDAIIAAIEAEFEAHDRRVLFAERIIMVFVLLTGIAGIWIASGGTDGLIRQHYRIEVRP